MGQNRLVNTANIAATGALSTFDFEKSGSANLQNAAQSGRNASFPDSSSGTGNLIDINLSGDFNCAQEWRFQRSIFRQSGRSDCFQQNRAIAADVSGLPVVEHRPLKNKKARRCLALLFVGAAYWSQLSTFSPPCFSFQAFRTLWLPPFVSTTSPVSGFL